MNRIRQILFLVLATAILVPSSSEATVLLSNLAEATRDATPISFEQWAAQAFITDGGSYTLTSIEVLLGNLTGPPTEVAIELHADGGPFNIGATLTTFSVPGIPSGGAELRTLTPNSNIVLAPNTTYWLVFAVLAGSESLEWTYAEGNNSTGPGSFGSYGYSLDAGASWENFGVDNPYKMEIEVSQISGVPEPTLVLLLVSGLGAALASGLQRKSA